MFIGSVVGDILRRMWYTGMRPDEVCTMRPFDILRDDPACRLYIPGRDSGLVGKHKTVRFTRVGVLPLTSERRQILYRRETPAFHGGHRERLLGGVVSMIYTILMVKVAPVFL